jgi:hybrid cluster-associated redox disulfide protein
VSSERITKDTTVEEILKYPGTSSTLVKHGIHCPTCPFAQFEIGRLKIGDVARNYGVDVDALLKALNETVGKP